MTKVAVIGMPKSGKTFFIKTVELGLNDHNGVSFFFFDKVLNPRGLNGYRLKTPMTRKERNSTRRLLKNGINTAKTIEWCSQINTPRGQADVTWKDFPGGDLAVAEFVEELVEYVSGSSVCIMLLDGGAASSQGPTKAPGFETLDDGTVLVNQDYEFGSGSEYIAHTTQKLLELFDTDKIRNIPLRVVLTKTDMISDIYRGRDFERRIREIKADIVHTITHAPRNGFDYDSDVLLSSTEAKYDKDCFPAKVFIDIMESI